MLLGFGIGYSLLAFRKESESELIWGVAFLLVFGGLAARIAWFHWARP